MEKADKPRLLIVGDNGDDDESEVLDDFDKLLPEGVFDYRKAETSDKARQLFAELKPQLLLLTYRKLQKSEEFYLELLRNSDQAPLTPHRVIILCKQGDADKAYDLCRRNIFDDYVIVWPLFDLNRLKLTLQQAQDRIMQSGASDEASKMITGSTRAVEDLFASLKETLKNSAGLQQGVDANLDNLMTGIFGEIDSLQQRLADQGPTGSVEAWDQALLKEEFNHFKENRLKSHFRDSREDLEKEMDNLSGSLEGICASEGPVLQKLVEANPSGAGKVLVVDDDELYLEVLNSILEPAGYQVTEVGDGLAGLHMLVNTRPDVMLVDFDMPGLNGLELIAQVKTFVSDEYSPQIIMISGNKNEQLVRQAIEKGVNDFIIKPASAKIILQKVARQMRNAQG